MRKFKLLFLFIWSFLSSCKGQIPEQRPNILNSEFDKKISNTIHFSIPVVGVEEVKDKTEAIFLDAREADEFEISHLPNAIHVGYQKFSLKKVQAIPKDAEIIIYCSIGYRSEKIGKELIDAGFTNVSNLYGSIFEWVNQGQPIIDNQGHTTHQLHTYNKTWSKWVDSKQTEKMW